MPRATSPSSSPQQSPDGRPDDPVYLHARREAIVILSVWTIALVWSLTVYLGWGHAPLEGHTVLWWGIPRWVVLGIALPWIVADLFAAWFCFFFMADDDLGEAHEGLDLDEENRQRSRHEGPADA